MACRALILMSVVAMSLGCGANPTPPGDGSKRLVASATTVRLQLGQKLELPVSAVDENGNRVSLDGASFQVHGDLVAAVSDIGLVSGLEPGGDTVVVRLDGDSVAIEIQVEYPDGITHPEGVVAATTGLPNRPFGVAVNASGTRVYVTNQRVLSASSACQ